MIMPRGQGPDLGSNVLEGGLRAFLCCMAQSLCQPRRVPHCLTSALRRAEVKAKLRMEWAPEYDVEDFKVPDETVDTVSERRTAVSLPLCLEEKKYM